MYPSEFQGDVWAEEQVFNALTELDDGWRVISDVLFPVERPRRQTLDGQVDFLLLHPEHGGFIIEVKGGEIRAVEGDWFTRNQDGEFPIKDPFKQASGYKYPLGRLLEAILGVKIFLQHAVAFPSTSCASQRIGPHSRDIILFEEDLRDVRTAISRIVSYWQSPPTLLRADQIKKVVDCLTPTVMLERRLVADVNAALEEQLRLTQEQQTAFNLVKGFRRLWVTGGAGTGKTVLATARAREVAAAGDRALLLCFNRNLGDELKRRLADAERADVGSRDAFAMSVSRIPWNDQPGWSKRALADEFVNACADQGLMWDSILIDEAQDFGGYWLQALEQLVTDDGQLILFADANQDIFGAGGAVGMPKDPIVLSTNCRNTPEIAEVFDPLVGAANHTLVPSGLEPEFIPSNDPERALRKALHDLIRKGGVDPADVVILCSDPKVVTSYHGRRFGSWDFTEFGGGGVVCETIGRFKGLEAKAVIAVINDARGVDRNLLYVAMSRARAVLKVVAPPSEMEAIERLITPPET